MVVTIFSWAAVVVIRRMSCGRDGRSVVGGGGGAVARSRLEGRLEGPGGGGALVAVGGDRLDSRSVIRSVSNSMRAIIESNIA